MHDEEIIQVYMWIVVEEVRVHQSVMAWGMVFGVVVLEVVASRGPVNIEVALVDVIPDPVEAHVDRLLPCLLGCIVCKSHFCGVFTCMGVGGWGCPSSSRVVRIGKASLELRKVAPIAASAAEDMPVFMSWPRVRMATFLVGRMGGLLLLLTSRSARKKWPPAWLRARSSQR